MCTEIALGNDLEGSYIKEGEWTAGEGNVTSLV